jgi:hypothetical protein
MADSAPAAAAASAAAGATLFRPGSRSALGKRPPHDPLDARAAKKVTRDVPDEATALSICIQRALVDALRGVVPVDVVYNALLHKLNGKDLTKVRTDTWLLPERDRFTLAAPRHAVVIGDKPEQEPLRDMPNPLWAFIYSADSADPLLQRRVLDVLLETGCADLFVMNSRDHQGRTPIMELHAYGCRRLLAHPNIDLSAVSDDGACALNTIVNLDWDLARRVIESMAADTLCFILRRCPSVHRGIFMKALHSTLAARRDVRYLPAHFQMWPDPGTGAPRSSESYGLAVSMLDAPAVLHALRWEWRLWLALVDERAPWHNAFVASCSMQTMRPHRMWQLRDPFRLALDGPLEFARHGPWLAMHMTTRSLEEYDQDGMNALQRAVWRENHKVISSLLQRCTNATVLPVCRAVNSGEEPGSNGYVEELQPLLDIGMPLRQTNTADVMWPDAMSLVEQRLVNGAYASSRRNDWRDRTDRHLLSEMRRVYEWVYGLYRDAVRALLSELELPEDVVDNIEPYFLRPKRVWMPIPSEEEAENRALALDLDAAEAAAAPD